MRKYFQITDPTVNFIKMVDKKINNIGTLTFYFNRLTKTSMLPIEVSFVKFNNKIIGVSPQLNNYFLDFFDDKFTYYNDIIFNSEEINKLIDSLPNKKTSTSLVETMNTLFGIDMSNVPNVEGLKFDKIQYVENIPVDSNSLTSDGYIFYFTDIASSKLKLGFFVGNIRPLKFNEYQEILSEYGKSKILNDVIVITEGRNITIKNNTPFVIRIEVATSTYQTTSKKYGEKIYKRVPTKLSPIVINPHSSITLTHDTKQEPLEYTLCNNPIDYYNDSFSNKDYKIFINQKPYMQYKPFEIKLTDVGLPLPTKDVDKFFTISSLDEIINLDKTNKLILNKKNDISISTVDVGFGSIKINSTNKMYSITANGMIDLFFQQIKTSALFKLNDEQYAINYDIPTSKHLVTQITIDRVLNNVTSEFMEFAVFQIVNRGDLNDFGEQNTKLLYNVPNNQMDTITDKNIEQRNFISTMLGSDTFKHNIALVNINDISDINNTRKAFEEDIFKTHIPEIDAANNFYLKRQKQAVSSYKFAEFDLDIDVKTLIKFGPNNNVWDLNSKNSDSFTYHIREHLSDLGYEIALNEALKRLKSMAYIYSPNLDVLSVTNIGVSLDGRWYFCGSDFYRAEEIENPKITTYIDDSVIKYELPHTDNQAYIYSKKKFFGYNNDTSQEIETAKQLMYAIASNKAIPEDILISNPALNYIMSHLIDSNNVTYPNFRDIISFPANFINKLQNKDIKNKFIFPNIFKTKYSGDFSYGGIQKSAKKA